MTGYRVLDQTVRSSLLRATRRDDNDLQRPAAPVANRSTWRGDDDGISAAEFTYVLNEAELAEVAREGARLGAADEDLGTVGRADYTLPACSAGIAAWPRTSATASVS